MTNTTMPPSPAAEVQAAAATMLRMIQGLHISRAVYVAAKLGISDTLAMMTNTRLHGNGQFSGQYT